MTLLTGADIITLDATVNGGSLLIENGLIKAVLSARPTGLSAADVIDLRGHTIVPGFVDVHIHGLEGVDVLDGPDAVADVARRLPKYGVTAFCPTSVACAPDRLRVFLEAIGRCRQAIDARSARVLGAHLESNFLNPDWNGAQPRACLRAPRGDAHTGDFSADDILRVIADGRPHIDIVTLAPEITGGLELVREFVRRGHRVSLGHSGATYEQAKAAIAAGARHATHLFNRMSSITSREPGLVGAVFESNAVTAEIICDGHHVHRALISTAIRAKSPSRMIAITDGTAAAGLPAGTRARLGDQIIIAGERTALLEDGTLAGSMLTMDGAFRMLRDLGWTFPEVARMCATNAAEAVRLPHSGCIADGHVADLVVLDEQLSVRQTYVGGVALLEH